MADLMTFPNTVEEFMDQYKIKDTEQIYTNGVELVPIFRMKQWFEHADFVPVVRCKDCQHCEWYIRAHYKNGVEVESLECRKYKMAVTRDWFCADGERREE